tara:strand:+ start:4483 stop:5721 length:1239 start_codon:yes stop_codon:yes gene_type:complete
MVLNLTSTTILSLLIAFFSAFLMFLVNIFLGNFLDVETFGKYSVIRNSIIFIPLVINLGISNSITIIHKKVNVFDYNWHFIFNRSFLISFFVCLLCCCCFSYFFNFSNIEFSLIFLINLFLGRIILANSIFRLSSNFILAQITRNLWRFIFLLLLILTFYLKVFDSNILMILILIFSSILIALFFVLYKENHLSNGKKVLSYENVLKYGFMFFLLGLCETFLSQLDKFLIGYDLGYSIVGNYSIISLIPLTTYNISASSIGLIIMPYIINNKKDFSLLKNVLIIIILIPVLIYMLLTFQGINITKLLFNIEFQSESWIQIDYKSLFLYSNFLGLLQYLQLIAYFLIGAFLNEKDIRNITFLNILIIILFFIFITNFSSINSINQYLIYFILIWKLRLIINFYYLFKNFFNTN